MVPEFVEFAVRIYSTTSAPRLLTRRLDMTDLGLCMGVRWHLTCSHGLKVNMLSGILVASTVARGKGAIKKEVNMQQHLRHGFPAS